jgi:succinyl-CoA synthetase beta subunit
MARVKISEYQAKTLLTHELALPWQGWRLSVPPDFSFLKQISPGQKLVVKVDQGIKKRAKQGLLSIRITPGVIRSFVTEKSAQNFQSFLVEPFIPHSENEERYLSLERTREGIKVLYSAQGGVEIESHWQAVSDKIDDSKIKILVENLKVVFDKYHFCFLEINPLVVVNGAIHFLDLAVEIDDAALSLPELSCANLIPITEKVTLPSEKAIKQLDAATPASLKYQIINPNGAIWMLLSGGGASLVLADEVADSGYGQELANYGEYSGSPTTEDTYLYTRVLLEDLLRSKAAKKVLLIAGGVANFTDVAKTFKGVIQALEEKKGQLQTQNVKIFVRRGGPNQARGLQLMADFLKANGLYGEVLGPQRPLTEIVNIAIKNL